ncbi:GTP-binding protein HSR1 [Vibrio alfacsensis]|uniref:GTP-binding protein HSR1 n=1 Tax=Vibrio alfacsensis TaxID=1074311 RepID=A0ABM6YTE5_9VIBR|nr:GTPase [Vibrio alfacsensis]AXY00934.1 GTP-binding protein HSR1 [Vibrio alfacsensis]
MSINAQTYRSRDISARLDDAKLPVLDVMFTGVTGAGKSSTINALFGSNKVLVGHGVDPMTMELDAYYLQNAFRVWDTPGLGDGAEQDRTHERKLIDLLFKTWSADGETYGFIDMVIVIIEGINRDMGTTYRLLRNTILPCINANRVVVAINQADVAQKGRGWDHKTNTPTVQLTEFLEQQALSIQRRIKESCGITINKPIYFSAEHRYNLDKLMDAIIVAMPSNRRQITASE